MRQCLRDLTHISPLHEPYDLHNLRLQFIDVYYIPRCNLQCGSSISQSHLQEDSCTARCNRNSSTLLGPGPYVAHLMTYVKPPSTQPLRTLHLYAFSSGFLYALWSSLFSTRSFTPVVNAGIVINVCFYLSNKIIAIPLQLDVANPMNPPHFGGSDGILPGHFMKGLI